MPTIAKKYPEANCIFRLKLLKEGAYTQAEAEAAVGMRIDNGPRQAAREKTHDMEVEMEDSGFVGEEQAT